ncbi:MAG: ABC transporter ATP-binding protein [Clostridiales bacterium]|nr:ABC transporter ATP-binding protein [Clostridiales bacterium]
MIEIKNLNYTYRVSGKHAVQNLSFTIEKGEVFGLLGPSGAGKTTTQRLVIGLLSGYQGSVKIMGTERSAYKKEFFEEIGIAFDFPNLYLKLTAKENLDLLSSYYKNKRYDSLELLEKVGLLPDKDKKVQDFSKGMKMRLNFIRSLMHDPKILFFDEPTSGLDPVNAKIIKDMILELKSEGKTIFLTTHNMTVAEQLCDRVAFMVDGKIPVIDAPKQLMIEYGDKVVNITSGAKESEQKHSFKLDHIGTDHQFIELIQSGTVRTIHSKEATLEEVFIRLTGKELI